MKRLFRRSALALLALVLLAVAGDVATYDAAAWQADLDRVERDMASGYANLDWIAQERGLDLQALDRATRARLANAHSRVRAFLALREFIRAFRDPHLRLKWGERPIREARSVAGSVSSTDAAAEPAEAPAGEDCAAADYEEGEHAFRLPFASLPGWRALPGTDFPSGIAGELGVLRIAQFGEDQYLSACEAVFAPGIGERALQLAVRARQQEQLRAALASLRAAGARRLLVDVTGNGGGTEWVGEVIALMTPRKLQREEARVVAPACDRRGVWQGKPGCSVFGPEEPRASLQGSGEWRGELLILADRHTGSASEDFVAWLQQNRVARVLGERTAGAGCGYVDGGTRTQLRASHFDVMMPNCARYLDDGTNEIEGIAPDVAIDMQAENELAKVRAVAAAMRGK